MDLISAIWFAALLVLVATIGHYFGGVHFALGATSGTALIYGVLADLTDR